ncbi:MAG: UDP-3-O-(3-hydroxymyristoyl)glucosamine N-acyltransferase [Candidatus Rokubacteria bacterium 13_1_20CM_2_69_58]|nr:MAG: UDP-3-O-(3-hydroxymyristoyl)glucosamine N-acyltransferase [Candidatus Rokubacteria bacterium 13_2_20CM_70_12]OLD28345.1 MAG: UDP-3-O-(3-hydroxymyristoyl)glucosamine N-acyltransferase [Candidatus Rokubacteria bacterium 13_1_40CM_2_70_45]OLD75917.1 MAG: UDP-3-O-(3-hydroxymyristoyl)glucosamine N-acyltransferase [Candidatus Rokubacteria bacterium 13_1_20CM_4_70_14]OLE50291.1 MAG: UDP-3-O-(3-hydroxymyristoyl)glucosamine N-acyltransferase [Candidatus Rokubacteria bacterium 13_1_20CM_2_69_58]
MGAGFTLRELARALHATLEGDAAAVVIGVAPLESAGPDQISFLVDARYVEAAKASRAGAFLAGPEVSGLPAPVLRVPAPQQALIELLTLFHPPAEAVAGVAPSAVVARDASVAPTATVGALAVIESGAVIGPHVRIGPLAFVGAGAEVGEASVVHARVAVCARVRLGKRVVVHPGAVIGADGFGYAFDGEAHRKIPQVGSVVVEDDVEIGANATVDRATLGQTIIRRGTKIDNLVQIGHNVEIGEHSIIVAQVGISGSCRVGRGVVLAGQVGVADHLTIGDGAVVAAQSGLARDVAPGEKVFGTPARPLIEAKRIFVLEGELPELARRLRSAERRLAQLEARLGAGGA